MSQPSHPSSNPSTNPSTNPLPHLSDPPPSSPQPDSPESDAIRQGVETLRQEFLTLCGIADPLEQHYRLIYYAERSDLDPTEYRQLFQQFKDEHLSREQQASLLDDLKREFDALSRISSPIERNYRMMQRARASDVDTDEYRKLFEEYERQSADGLGGILNNGLHRLAALAGFLGQFTIIVGLILFIAEAGSRKQEAHTRSWEIITASKGATESGGRIQAIETLKQGCSPRTLEPDPLEPIDLFQPQGWQAIEWRNIPILGGFFPDCVSLRGLDIADAHLPRINMSWAELSNARMPDTGLWSANLEGAQLRGAQLQRAKLRNAELRGANLDGAQLQNSDLAGARFGCSLVAPSICTTLKRADLTGANLRGDQRDNGVIDTLFYLRSLPPQSSINLDDAVLTRALYDQHTKLNICKRSDWVNGLCAPGSHISLIDFRDWTVLPNDSAFFNPLGEKESLQDYACPDMPDGICVPESLKAFREILDDAFASAYEISDSAKLMGAILFLAELSDAHLSGAKLNGADLRGVRLQDADLSSAVLRNADMSCIESQEEGDRPRLICANLREADLRDADLRGATLTRANLAGADLRQANLSCDIPEGIDPTSVPCRVAPAQGTDGEVLSGANLAGTNLSQANLGGTNLTGTNLAGANLAEARLVGATGWTVDQLRAATNWELAIYDDEQRSQLGLTD